MIQVWKRSLLYGGELDGVATATVVDTGSKYCAQGTADISTYTGRGRSWRSRRRCQPGGIDDRARRTGGG